jgi:hypothetical protein
MVQEVQSRPRHCVEIRKLGFQWPINDGRVEAAPDYAHAVEAHTFRIHHAFYAGIGPTYLAGNLLCLSSAC